MDHSYAESDAGNVAGQRPLKILLADHLKLVRESLRHAIHHTTDDMHLIECDNFDEAAGVIQEKPGLKLAILAHRLPGMNGLEGLQKVRNYDSELPIAIISAFYQYIDILRTFESGAKGFLSKEMDSSAIISAIRYILSGERFVPAEVIEVFTNAQEQNPDINKVDPLLGLTDREMEVLDLLLRGHSNKLMARLLKVEEVTIKMHITRILRKLHAENRTQAVAIVYRARCQHCPHLPVLE